MTRTYVVLLAAVLALAVAVAAEALELNRSREREAAFQHVAEQWKQANRDFMERAADALRRLQAGAAAAADDTAVCVSMLPPEQRRSFRGGR